MKNHTRKRGLLGLLLGFVLLATACGGGGGGGRGAGDLTTPSSSTTVENPTESSSTAVENPIGINLKGATALVLENAPGDNLKKMTDGGALESALTINASATSSKATVPATIPGVSSFVQGPNNELIIWLTSSISVNGEPCQVVYYRESDDKTICASPLGSKPQFDALGNIYYEDNNDIIVRWVPDTNERKDLTNQYISVNQWLVHASGDVFVNGTSDGANIFRRINISGSAEDYLDGSSNVASFRFVDKNHIFLYKSGDAFVLTIYGADKGKLEQQSTALTGSPNASLFQQASNGVFYSKNSGGSGVYEIYPGPQYKVPLNLTGLKQFKAVDLNLYATGQRNTKHALVLTHLNENKVAVDLLGNNDLEVFDFMIVNEWLYFNALRLADNKIVFGEINLNTMELNIIDDTLGSKYLQMETRKIVRNESFSAVDDVRSLLTPPFSAETVYRDAFKNLGKVSAIGRLTGDYGKYLAVIADTKIHFFDMTVPDAPQEVSELAILSAENIYELHMHQSGTCVFVSGLFANSTNPTINCVDVSDITKPVLKGNNEVMFGAWGNFVNNENFVVGFTEWAVEPWNFSNVMSPSMVASFVDAQSGIAYTWKAFFPPLTSSAYSAEINPKTNVLHVLASKNNQLGIYNFDIHDLSAIKLVSSSPIDVGTNHPDRLVHLGSSLFAWRDGNLSNSTVVGDYESVSKISSTSIWNSSISDLAVSASYAFLRNENQLFVVDLGNPDYPRLVQIVDAPKNNLNNVTGDGDQFTIYLGTDSGVVEMHLVKQ